LMAHKLNVLEINHAPTAGMMNAPPLSLQQLQQFQSRSYSNNNTNNANNNHHHSSHMMQPPQPPPPNMMHDAANMQSMMLDPFAANAHYAPNMNMNQVGGMGGHQQRAHQNKNHRGGGGGGGGGKGKRGGRRNHP
jgi:hypothetical protein